MSESVFSISLYLWDAFYCQPRDPRIDAKTWRRLECATSRIRDAVSVINTHHVSPMQSHRLYKRWVRAHRECIRLLSPLDPEIHAVVFGLRSLSRLEPHMIAAGQSLPPVIEN